MAHFEKQTFEGERALFQTLNAEIVDCVFENGESPLKESRDLTIRGGAFSWKYPLWYCHNVSVDGTEFHEMARAGIWYSHNLYFRNIRFACPKSFRQASEIRLTDCEFALGEETLWWCHHIDLKNVVTHGNYFAMNSHHIHADHLRVDGNYAFDGCKHIRITNSVLNTKDAFWNCEDVVVEDSVINGEYFAWNSKDIVLIRCKISSHQGFCYMKNIHLIDCEVVDSDLTFEYCEDIDATILTEVDSIKNPISGVIRCKGVKELVLNDCDPSKTRIEVRK